jgi:hypothetical protein
MNAGGGRKFVKECPSESKSYMRYRDPSTAYAIRERIAYFAQDDTGLILAGMNQSSDSLE